MAVEGERLVATVRGRRLLWELLTPLHTSTSWCFLDLNDEPPPASTGDLLRQLRFLVAGASGGVVGPDDLRVALAATVDHARYWQPPSTVEAVLAAPEFTDALRPLAAMVTAASPAWWSGPFDATAQHRVHWDHEGGPTDGVAPGLDAWHAAMVDAEARAEVRNWASDTAWSGEWWSTPGSQLPSTTRSAEGLPAVHLALVEDESGWSAADVAAVSVAPGVRVLEVAAAEDWAALVARHPLEVTHSRRHDWARATGRHGRWFMPDFAALARDFDAVHVSVSGYLDTAGRAVPVPGHRDGATVLAGWSPDQTWWLRPELLTAGSSQRWERVEDPHSPWEWTRVG